MINRGSGMTLELGGHTLELLPERAAYWRARSTLLVADCHFGKAATFRHHGMAVPEGGTEDDLGRLESMIARTKADRMVVVGDFFHAPGGMSVAVVEALDGWRRRHRSLDLVLVPGNHDGVRERVGPALGLRVEDAVFDAGGLVCVHDPAEVGGLGGGGPFVCGHLHPAVRLGNRRVRGLQAPCFWLQGAASQAGGVAGTPPQIGQAVRVLVLPSFGSFTGHVTVNPRPSDRIFAVADALVVEVPSAVLRAGGGKRW